MQTLKLTLLFQIAIIKKRGDFMSKKTKIIIPCVLVLAVIISALLIYFMPDITMNQREKKYSMETVDLSKHGDRIYFLNTGGADAILIESEGKYALVDGAEDSDNPRGFPDLAFEGTEDYVVDAVRKIAGDENGIRIIRYRYYWIRGHK